MTKAMLLTTFTLLISSASAADWSGFDSTLACGSYATGGCECSAAGYVNKANAGTTNCSGSQAHSNYCFQTCCSPPTTPICMSYDCTAQGKMSGGVGVAATPQGATPATTCCKEPPTCSQITCSSTRRRDAGYYKKKASVDSTKCTDRDDCHTKCCEVDATFCGTALQGNYGTNGQPTKSCPAATHVKKPDYQCNGATYVSPSSAYTTKFTDDTTFNANCCDARATCSATHACPSHMERKDPMPTTKCSGATCSDSECCTPKSNACQMNCSGAGPSGAQWNHLYAPCSGTAPPMCANTACGTGMYIDQTKTFTANSDTAAWKASCCITPQAAPAPPPAAANAKCSAYWSAAAEAGSKTSGASLMTASSMVGAFVTMIAALF